ncbi:11 kDa late embryogenesis abundant protein [Malania oleifera]|uniref:11 kDa late embryogenesis abundant protein n=1 Tax=Malania oleifera TaxID=397392 RepID=UPI0025ADDCBA|nr:11 kDa late embryogenesis abundant protein [Malania oleifera]
MQAGKNAAATVKESVANVGASAKSGLEKTKAAVQEKVDKMTAHDPVEKEVATQKKEERIEQAELNKREERENNAAARQASAGTHGTATTTGSHLASGTTPTHTYSTTGTQGQTTGRHEMSAVPGHGAGQPAGSVTEGVPKSHPVGINTETGGTVGENSLAEGTAGGCGSSAATGYGTGGAVPSPGYSSGRTYR